MAEVNVMKPAAAAKPEPVRRPFGMMPFRSGFFNMNPFAMMKYFGEDMERMFTRTPGTFLADTTWTPAIEVREKEGKLFVTADLPGVKKEDVKVHVENGRLFIEGKRNEEKEEKREGFYHSERVYGDFFRAIPLPENALPDMTAANFNNGVLEVTVPVPAAKAVRHDVPVKAA